MRGKVFISGKMTGLPDFNHAAFDDAAQKLRQAGYFVLNPASLPVGLAHEEYMHICYAMIDVCDIVHFLNGWHMSVGARQEFDYAIAKGKRIEFQDPKDACYAGGVE